MERSLRLLIATPLLGALLAGCGSGSVPVIATGGDAAAGTSSSGSSSSGSSTSSSGSGSSAGSGVTTDVLTYHNDAMRTGQNLTETVLTPSNVNSSGFGLLHQLAADGRVDVAPLLVSQLMIAGVSHNVVYFASEHDSVYAYDSDSGALLQQVSLLGSGESPSDAPGCAEDQPEIGITGTPVIDRSAGPNGTMFVVATSRNASGTYFQRLHALDLVTLADRMPAAVVQATSAGTATAFAPSLYKERGALLLQQGQIFTVWGSDCDIGGYNGWVIAYNESALTQTQVLNVTPNGTQGGIWDAAGLAADSAGGLYTLVGNGSFDTTLTSGGLPLQQDYGNAAIRLSLTGGSLAVADYFTMWDTVSESYGDIDLGSGSPLLLPDQIDSSGTTRHLMLAAGKDSNIYLIDRDNMGKYNGNVASDDSTIYQELDGVLPGGMFSAPAYFNGSVYIGNAGGTLKQYALGTARLPSTATSQSTASFSWPGTSPSISANGSSNAIIWAVQSGQGIAAVLHAYDPANLAAEYYNSTQAANNRDAFGNGNKFITPVIANGKVYVGTPGGVAVFGLL